MAFHYYSRVMRRKRLPVLEYYFTQNLLSSVKSAPSKYYYSECTTELWTLNSPVNRTQSAFNRRQSIFRNQWLLFYMKRFEWIFLFSFLYYIVSNHVVNFSLRLMLDFVYFWCILFTRISLVCSLIWVFSDSYTIWVMV